MPIHSLRTSLNQRTPRSAAQSALRAGPLGAAIACAAAMLTACGSSGEAKRERIREVEPAAFRAAAGEPGAVRPLAASQFQATPQQDPSTINRPTNRPSSSNGFRVVPGDPVSVADVGRPLEGPQLLDAKVGDINGRPVFASQFLGSIEGRLRAEARERTRREWMPVAAGIIQQEMRALITDELLKAEALSKLSVEQKAGLRRFLDDVRKNLLSQNRGSQQLAEERLRREQGLSQEEFLREREDRTLVRFTLQEEIQDRINVSWRDILQRYARDADRYNPDPVAQFYLLGVEAPPHMIPAEDGADQAAADDGESNEGTEQTNEPTAYDEVVRRLGEGESFIDLAASDLNTWTLDPEGKLDEYTVEGEFSEIEPFGPDVFNTAAQQLSEGEISEPIVHPLGSRTYVFWIHLASIEQSSTSLYDAQLTISDQIRNERTNVELERYIDRLLGRASVSDVEDMMVRLLDIAAERFGPQRGAGTGPGSGRG